MSEYGVGLIDLGPPEFSVTLRGRRHFVYGLSALSVFDLIKLHPEIQALMQQQFSAITPENLMKMGPVVALRIMAMGLLKRSGFTDEKKWLEAVNDGIRQLADLGMAEQIDLLDTVLTATMPQGKDPFIERLNHLKSLFNPGPQETSAPSTNSHASSDDVSLRTAPTHGVRPLDS